ncbi:MAG: hypothetical protein ACXADH_16355, partial [Candidatus Kariarchaeaceae archaeon]
RRSSGIDGMQDFYGIAVIPRSMDQFCVSLTLRNVYVYDYPPVPSDPPPPYTSLDVIRVQNYLNRRYPPGTPIEDLDIDLSDQIRLFLVDRYGEVPYIDFYLNHAISWTVNRWILSTGNTNTVDQSLMPERGAVGVLLTAAFRHPDFNYHYTVDVQAAYKTLMEVKLEMERARYQAEITISPLNCGFVFNVPHTLRTCFQISNNVIIATNSQVTSGDPIILSTPNQTCYIPGAIDIFLPNNYLDYREKVNDWNQFDVKLYEDLKNRLDWLGVPIEPADPGILDVQLFAYENMSPHDPNNENLLSIADSLNLKKSHLNSLERSGVTDLRSLAMALNNAESIRLYRKDRKRIRKILKENEQNVQIITRPTTLDVAQVFGPTKLPFPPLSKKLTKQIQKKILKSNQVQFGRKKKKRKKEEK